MEMLSPSAEGCSRRCHPGWRWALSGETWEAHAELTHASTWLIENALVQRRDGSLLMVFRTQVRVGAQPKQGMIDFGKEEGTTVHVNHGAFIREATEHGRQKAAGNLDTAKWHPAI
jgi:hypothetical protein